MPWCTHGQTLQALLSSPGSRDWKQLSEASSSEPGSARPCQVKCGPEDARPCPTLPGLPGPCLLAALSSPLCTPKPQTSRGRSTSWPWEVTSATLSLLLGAQCPQVAGACFVGGGAEDAPHDGWPRTLLMGLPHVSPQLLSLHGCHHSYRMDRHLRDLDTEVLTRSLRV